MTDTTYQQLVQGLNALARAARRNSVEHGFGVHGDRLRATIERRREDSYVEDELEQAEVDYTAYLGNRLMLIAGEVAEAHEELRSGHEPNETYYTYEGQRVSRGRGDFAHLWQSDDLIADDNGETGPSFSTTNPAKPEGVPAELADVLIRVFDTAQELGIDLEHAVAEKMTYNASRPSMHGRKF